MDFSTQIKNNSDSAHPDLSKTVPTAPLAPLAAELRDPEVKAFFAKIAIFAAVWGPLRPGRVTFGRRDADFGQKCPNFEGA